MVRSLAQLDHGTVVVLPSATFPESELRKIVGIQHYEERLLCTTSLLAERDVGLVYITSLPIDEAVVDYYLGFLPDPADARRRFHQVVVGEDSGRALSAKVLDAPGVIERVRELIDGAENAYLSPFNVTTLEGRVAELLDLPLFGASPSWRRSGRRPSRAGRRARRASPSSTGTRTCARSPSSRRPSRDCGRGVRTRRPR